MSLMSLVYYSPPLFRINNERKREVSGPPVLSAGFYIYLYFTVLSDIVDIQLLEFIVRYDDALHWGVFASQVVMMLYFLVLFVLFLSCIYDDAHI